MRRSTKALLLATSALVPLGLAHSTLANPVGASVATGTAQVAGDGTASVIVNQSTDKAIINWQSFNIGNGETTQFVQPNASSVTLNRVTGGLGTSQIDGALKANGNIFLINPDGILFGPHSVVDVGGLVATTNDIKNDDFMAGRYVFSQPGKADASVVNAGNITAATGGFAALVAPGVRNAGTITARLGKIGLAAGNGFTLDFYGDQLLTLKVGDEIGGTVKDVQTGQTLDALVKNEGVLKADGGVVQLTAAAARQVVDSVINTTGVIEANSVGMKNGKIVLSAATADTKPAGAPVQTVKVSGTLSVAGKKPGETGGKVQITGEDIALDGTTIEASGPAGGGTVLVGGDTSGSKANPAVASIAKAKAEATPVPTASNVTVDPTSKINVSATDNGNGGKAIVWANFANDFSGTIYGRGGPKGGDGGFAEVSGKQDLHFGGPVVLEAPIGAAGTLLLDPLNVVIGGTGSSGLSIADLQNALATGNVIVSTDATGSDAGDIEVAQSLSTTSSNALTLSANNDITFDNGVTWSNPGGAVNLTLRADSDANGSGNVVFNGTSLIDGTGSTGTLSIFYNSPAGYTSPTDFTPHVVGFPGQFTAYMLVNNILDLQAVQENVSGNYALGQNIDATDTENWNSGRGFIPIGYYHPSTGTYGGGFDALQFSGTFDGQGFAVDKLKIAEWGNDLGLFAKIGAGAAVRNIHLTNVSMNVSPYATSNVGPIAGENAGLIENAYAAGVITGGALIADVGGIAGANDVGGEVANSYSSVNIESGGTVGGIVGGNSFAGVVYRSFADGSIRGHGATGGLVGFNSGWVIDSYSIASVVGDGTGMYDGTGGLAGFNSSFGSIYGSYAAGIVTGSLPVGGVAGQNQGTVASSYWDPVATGQSVSAGGTARSTADFKASIPTDFSLFTWGLSASVNNGYPYLLWQTETGPTPPLSTIFKPPFGSPTPPPTTKPNAPTSKETGIEENTPGAGKAPAGSPWAPLVDAQTAAAVLPYAVLAAEANGESSSFSGNSFEATGISWQDYLRKANPQNRVGIEAAILVLEAVNFNAQVYVDRNTGETVIVFPGSATPLAVFGTIQDKFKFATDWLTNIIALNSDIPVQYDGALILSDAVRAVASQSNITLVGFSKGGGEASYAAFAGDKVVTFDAARNPASDRGLSTNEINIIVVNDPVGDPRGLLGSGALPGQYFSVQPVDPLRLPISNGPFIQSGYFTHNMASITAGLSALVPQQIATSNSTISP